MVRVFALQLETRDRYSVVSGPILKKCCQEPSGKEPEMFEKRIKKIAFLRFKNLQVSQYLCSIDQKFMGDA